MQKVELEHKMQPRCSNYIIVFAYLLASSILSVKKMPKSKASKLFYNVFFNSECQIPFVEKKDFVNAKCKEEIHYGKCRMGLQLWHYNSGIKECSEFVSGGCDKGPLFSSRKKCNKTCLKKGSPKKKSSRFPKKKKGKKMKKRPKMFNRKKLDEKYYRSKHIEGEYKEYPYVDA